MCSTDATCTKDPGNYGYNCVCRSGFSGNGIKCTSASGVVTTRASPYANLTGSREGRLLPPIIPTVAPLNSAYFAKVNFSGDSAFTVISATNGSCPQDYYRCESGNLCVPASLIFTESSIPSALRTPQCPDGDDLGDKEFAENSTTKNVEFPFKTQPRLTSALCA